MVVLGILFVFLLYCLEYKEKSDKLQAGSNYEKAIEQLVKTMDMTLMEGALAEVIAFFDRASNPKKKRFYENKFVKMTNDKAQIS